MKKSEKMKAIRLAKECAKDAIDAAGSSPTDHEGGSLLTPHPLEGDWDYFYEEMDGSVLTEEYKRVFEAAYSEITASENIKTIRAKAGMG